MSEIRVGVELSGGGGIDGQDPGLVARNSRRRLIDREVERSHLGKTSLASAAIALVRREHGMVEDVVYVRTELNCNTVIDVERFMHAEIGAPHGGTIDGVPDCYPRLSEQIRTHARQAESVRVPEEA